MNLLGGNELKEQINNAKEISLFIDEDITLEDFDEKVGKVKFGKYPQESRKSDEKTEIEWIVLENDKKNNVALLLSKYILDSKCYHDKFQYVTWENCLLREWLNEEFLEKAFTKEEQKKIMRKLIKNNDNEISNTKGGEDTKDKIFCLSIDECKEYFGSKVNDNYPSNDLLATKGTKYAMSNDLWGEGENPQFEGYGNPFWLRCSGTNQEDAAYVTNDGVVYFHGYNVFNYHVGVRPALWVKY